MSIRPVILSGGAGTRLWPTSRDTMPKQFAPLLGNRSSFELAVLRVLHEGFSERPLVVTSHAHLTFVERQLAAIGVEADILLEPLRRDTGPAILAAASFVNRAAPGTPMLVLPADHAIEDDVAFCRAVLGGLPAALAGRLVTFGVVPTRPATEYGYIVPGRPYWDGSSAVGRFVEKPPEAEASALIGQGALWNAGDFLFRADTVIAEYRRLDPATLAAVEAALDGAETDGRAVALGEAGFSEATKTSFDYAVMERTDRAAVIPLSCGWSDIGSWNTLWSLSRQDDRGNVPRGDVALHDVRGCYVSTSGPLTSLLGVENLIVVVDKDAVLVADRGRSAEVKQVVEKLRSDGRCEANSHSRAHRPWGWYEPLQRGDGYQVKRITVHPGGRLSLQTHRFRAEHWVVVAGQAHVTVGPIVRVLGPGEHAHIPLGDVHRLENFGDVPVELIEVQTGTYLGEDDIVRLEDVYRRASPALPGGPMPVGTPVVLLDGAPLA